MNKLNLSYTLAAPVLLGMMLKLAALPPLQSLDEGPSTVFWVAGSIGICHINIKSQETKQLSVDQTSSKTYQS
jgi:hypothetical protein